MPCRPAGWCWATTAGTKRAAGTGAGGPVKLVAMADLRQDRLDQSHTALSQAFGDRIDVPPGAAVPGLRRLSQGDRLPAAGRRGDADHARRLPRAAPRVCRAEGRQRVHGEGFRARSGRHQADPPGRRGGREEEPQDRRRADVPPFLRAPGPDPEDPRRRDGRHPAHPRLSHGFRLLHGPVPARRERAALAAQPRPSLPVPVVLRRRSSSS